ncbi:MAG: sigma-54-dependent Fis family transcriptional regulator [Ignavibacteriae bacterium]|nr:sigma-54-dependent Fis family transcriptional regulator [Ignavibacteriota bacterium]MCB9216638.1 sigma-54-dependent Fis family transcriptional regulator [Ignavibacteria bacterium]
MSIATDISQEELGIIGRSTAVREAVETLRRVAPTDLTVLLIGESGVGKEVFAQALHRLSSRAEKKMLSINCGAIPETLLESELFGHEKGAFTGAVESRKGIFEVADKGTIFLDEIGELTPATQVKLLRVLESGTFTRVGSTEEQTTDVRVVAATNRDLEEAVSRGEFRHDLYYRLNSAKIFIPPLRERREDIQLLFAYFAYHASARLGIPFGGIAPDAMEVLLEYPWPGNIRELKNFTELIITLEQAEKITADTVFEHLDTSRMRPRMNPYGVVHLPGKTPEQAERELIYRALIDLRNEVVALKEVVQGSYGGREGIAPNPEQFALPPSEKEANNLIDRLDTLNLEEIERTMIIGALRKFNNSRRRAADALGISERTLYRKLNQYKEEGYIDDDDGVEEEPGEE